MGEKADVVCEVQVLQLLREGPLDACPLACCRLPHDPVDHHQEDRRREQTALTDAGLYAERFRQFPVVDHLTCGVFVKLLDDGNELWWKAVVVHQSPDDISVHTVGCFLKVDKDSTTYGILYSNLVKIDTGSVIQEFSKHFEVMFLNAQSVRNKALDICDYIMQENLDLVFLCRR